MQSLVGCLGTGGPERQVRALTDKVDAHLSEQLGRGGIQGAAQRLRDALAFNRAQLRGDLRVAINIVGVKVRGGDSSRETSAAYGRASDASASVGGRPR